MRPDRELKGGNNSNGNGPDRRPSRLIKLSHGDNRFSMA
jgi:hypothetical protein